MHLQSGSTVTPELRLSQKLGEGAMGSIWSAQHLRLGHPVAIKFVSESLADENPQAFERFQREAEVLDGFAHPHVVRLFGRGQTPRGAPYIVMELLEGEPLVDYLEREGVLTLEEMTRLIEQLGGALDALHQKGIVHRDVKAENIFVRGSEETLTVKLFDFGLAKKPGEEDASKKLTGLGMMVGTAEYMSPEQIISSRDVDHHADLWALAVVSYVSLVAGLPFRGGDVAATFSQIRGAEFERPTAIRDDTTAPLDKWFERAFHMERKSRFDSARAMVEGWKKALSGISPAAISERPRGHGQPSGQAPAAGLGFSPGSGPSAGLMPAAAQAHPGATPAPGGHASPAWPAPHSGAAQVAGAVPMGAPSLPGPQLTGVNEHDLQPPSRHSAIIASAIVGVLVVSGLVLWLLLA